MPPKVNKDDLSHLSMSSLLRQAWDVFVKEIWMRRSVGLMGSGTLCFFLLHRIDCLSLFLSHTGSRCVGSSPFGLLLLFALGIKVCPLHVARGV